MTKGLHHPPIQLIRVLLPKEELHHDNDYEDDEEGNHNKEAQPEKSSVLEMFVFVVKLIFYTVYTVL